MKCISNISNGASAVLRRPQPAPPPPGDGSCDRRSTPPPPLCAPGSALSDIERAPHLLLLPLPAPRPPAPPACNRPTPSPPPAPSLYFCVWRCAVAGRSEAPPAWVCAILSRRPPERRPAAVVADLTAWRRHWRSAPDIQVTRRPRSECRMRLHG